MSTVICIAHRFYNQQSEVQAVNRSLCIGLLKSDLIYIILEDDPDINAADKLGCGMRSRMLLSL